MRLRTAATHILAVAMLLALAGPAAGQAVTEPELAAPEQAVSVEPLARDEAIERRIGGILEATGWYRGVGVEVEDGVVFLDGTTATEDHQAWARELAAKTQDVVAVVNRIRVRPEVDWDFGPALRELEELARGFVVALPLIVLALLILPLAWWASRGVARLIRRALAPRIESPFLGDVIARAAAIPVFLVGLYVVLQVAGLTQLALSLLGGAGVIGIVVGFAFRDIAENFLASLLLSIRRPFRSGDYIEVDGQQGLVQTMNTRSTVLLSLEGNHIQIPNATIFKNTIINYTAGAARRLTADVGIGYDAGIAEAQDVIVDVLRGHDAVLNEPPPAVLVESLGASTVNLRAYFWTNGHSFSTLKVRSAVLRLIKRALTERGISMPDDAREVIFPQGVPLIQREAEPLRAAPPVRPAPPAEPEAPISSAEGGLRNDAAELPDEVAHATIPEAETDLLAPRGQAKGRNG